MTTTSTITSGSGHQSAKPIPDGEARSCPTRRQGLVRVEIVEPHELMVAGWEQLLETAATGRYRVTAGGSPEHPDVTLYGVRPRERTTSHDGDLHALLRTTRSTVIATHWDDTPSAVDAALRCGVHGALSRRLPHEALLAGIESILGEEDPARCPPSVTSCHPEIALAGLTQREVDVLRLVAQGLTNQEIAERLYLSLNTVKSYIRYGYRKIGAERRSQAVIWAERHGLAAAGREGSATPPVLVEQPRGPAPARGQRAGADSRSIATGLVRSGRRAGAGRRT